MSKKSNTPKTRVNLCQGTNKKPSVGGLHWTINHTGKMSGMVSLSTSVAVNPLCQARAHAGAGLICEKCYADGMLKHRSSMRPALERNTEILTTRILEDWEIPVVNALQGRLESFGDSNNWVQAANYFKIARLNPRTTWAVWTKNPWHYAEAIERGHKKPKNLVIIQSSPFVDHVCRPRHGFIDKVFTVWSQEAIDAGQVINCGSRNCLQCGRCYRKNKPGTGIEYVHEKLKK